jgi:hypothetical protein
MMIRIFRQQADDIAPNTYHLKIIDVDANDNVRAIDVTAQTADPAQWLIDNQAQLATQLAQQPVHEALTVVWRRQAASDSIRQLPDWLREPGQVDAFIDANVTSLANARTVLKQMIRVLIWLARKNREE